MGFAGGNTGALPNHEHDPAVTRDGGSLAANATSAGLSDQSLLVSDGSNLQELTVGSDTNVLSISGGSLGWSAAASGGATLTRHSVTQNTATSTSSTSYVDVPNMDTTMTGTGAGNCISFYTTTVQSSNDFAFTCEWSTDGNIPSSPTYDGTGGAGLGVNFSSVSLTLGSQTVKWMQKLTSAGTLIVCRNSTDAEAQWLEIS